MLLWLTKKINTKRSNACDGDAAIFAARKATTEDEAMERYHTAYFYYENNIQANVRLKREAFIMKYFFGGDQAFKQGDYSKACFCFNVALKEFVSGDSFHCEAYTTYIKREHVLLCCANSFKQVGDYNSAKALFDEYLKINPNHLAALENSADIYAWIVANERSLRNALDKYYRLIDLSPAHGPKIWLKIVRVYASLFHHIGFDEFTLQYSRDVYSQLQRNLSEEVFKREVGEIFARSLILAKMYDVAESYANGDDLQLCRIGLNKCTAEDLEFLKEINAHLDEYEYTYLINLSTALMCANNEKLQNYAYEIKDFILSNKNDWKHSECVIKRMEKLRYRNDFSFKLNLFSQSKTLSAHGNPKQVVEIQTVSNR